MDGTGIARVAAGFGADDFDLCRKYDPDFPIASPVDGTGRFLPKILTRPTVKNVSF
jgi:isoleucyl-tRNA synthetase